MKASDFTHGFPLPGLTVNYPRSGRVLSTSFICLNTKNLKVPGRESTQSILAKKNNQMITYGPWLTNFKGLTSLPNFPDPPKGLMSTVRNAASRTSITLSTQLTSEIKLC